MDAQRWAVMESLYHAALAKQPNERFSYLAAACAEDPTLRSEIESLLAFTDVPLLSPEQRSQMAKLLHCPSEGAGLAEAIAAGTPPALPASLGRYRILRFLGEGGMGMVYEAEQDQPRRTVALKVIKPGFAGPEQLRRFEQESQALGRLQHPGIAQVHEAGTADGGSGPQPYFAMELIRGESLLRYAEAHQLNPRQRLELMAKVGDAVHHAHQRGIIHRDLKPGNILVDDSGQPKILDFGVARVTNSDEHATRQTDLGQLVGTLAYMSPEQVLADPLELDTRSDVYALGVILFELLAGRLPYKISTQMHRAVQTIREEDPAPLSSFSRSYRGDIETIVAKALAKDKTQRYSSASELAADIRRYLKDEPIAARRPSTTYQLQKFARRYQALVAGMAAVFVVLVAGIIASTWEATRARRAEQAATTQAATAKAVNDFLQNDLLAQASANSQARPDTKPDPDLKVRTALDRAAASIAGKFAAQPLVEASIRQTIGYTYTDLGLYSEAEPQLERAVELRRHVLGENHLETLGAISDLALLYLNKTNYAQAERLYTQVLEVRRRVLGDEHPDTLGAMSDLAVLYHAQGKYPQAELLCTQVLEVRRRVLGNEHPDTLDTMSDLAVLYDEQGRYAQAEPLYIKVLDLQRRVRGEQHPLTLMHMNNLAALYLEQGKYAQAEPLFTKAMEVERRVIGDEHPDTLFIMNNLAQLYLRQGEYAQAEALCTRALEVERRVLGDEHSITLSGMENLAQLYQDQGRYAQAEPFLTKALEVERRVLGEEHPDTLMGINNLAQLYQDQGRYAQAEPLLTKALEVQRRVLGEERPDALISMNNLAQLYLRQAKYAQAEALLRPGLNGYQKTTANTWQRYNSESMLGASLAGQEKYAEAEGLLASGYQGMLQRKATIPAASRFHLQKAGEWIIQLYQHWGKPDKAAEWRQKLNVTASAVDTQ